MTRGAALIEHVHGFLGCGPVPVKDGLNMPREVRDIEHAALVVDRHKEEGSISFIPAEK